ncbi:matrixin family metalloprotease [Nisaea acidiphila]|uniref:Matrixin family metalloprotease n=1 Tax=Nisaea acidiphila TaxID=1862145 RepID=A0A9J7ALG6_9PROT|nr:matrixin family metalloprotease [Nisaea acidiphila]UUX48320.1 matrixin family metalloprotease [Nisaea acidiphila]
MAAFASSYQLTSLSGHSIGIDGDFVASHDHAGCADSSCPLCQNSVAQSNAEIRAAEGGLSVQSSDLLGIVWDTETINYSFDGSGQGYESFSSFYQTEFETAMNSWAEVADIGFAETSTAAADWLIVWDPDSDGSGGVLGTAYYVDFDGDGKMEQGVDYVLIVMDPADTQYFFTTAIHEAGHGLGLAHIDHTSSIMSTYLDTSLSTITAYDIEVIQSLYGTTSSTTTTTVAVGTDAADSLFGTSADDILSGGNGSDTLSGGAGDDILYGNKQTDLIIGGSGADTIFGGQNDAPESGSPLAFRQGADTISGGDGNDILYGNHGGDIILGDSGADTIFGGQDSDTISGGAGFDDLYGNLGSDRFRYAARNEGWDYIYNYEAEDAIQLAGGVSVTGLSVDSSGDTVINLSSGTRIDLIGYSDSGSVTFEVI